MNGEDLAERVRLHYQTTDSPLLLADLGVALRKARMWPIEGDKRPLAQALAEIAPEISVLADPSARAFVVVTPKGEEARAHRAFAARGRERMLRRLPRSVILAFCAKVPDGGVVHLRKTPPYRYSTDADPGEDWWPVESEFRAPGLFVDPRGSVGGADADRLMSGIEAWAKKHGVDLDALARAEEAARKPSSRAVADAPAKAAANALERLCNAQPPELAQRLVVPMDIALLLSRTR